MLDYAFCEIINSKVASINNTPIQYGFCISNTKGSVSGLENKYEICKVGRTTNYTEGVVEDRLDFFFNRKFGHVKTLVASAKERFGKYLFSKSYLGLFPDCFFLIILLYV